MTFHEMYWRLDAIHKRNNEKFKELAILHGRKLKDSHSGEKIESKLTESQQLTLQRELEKHSKNMRK